MKVLITGSNGMLGQKLVYKLKHKNDIELFASSKGENRIYKLWRIRKRAEAQEME